MKAMGEMKRTVFIRLLAQLTIAVIIVAIVIGALVFRYTNSLLKEKTITTNGELLIQTEKIVKQALEEAQKTATSIAMNTDVQRSIWFQWKPEEDFSYLKNTSDLLMDSVNSSNYIDSIYIYSIANNKLLSDSGITNFTSSPFEYEIDSFIQKKMTSTWLSLSLPNSLGKEENMISFLTNVPLQNLNKRGVLIVNLKEDILYNAVINTNQSKLGNVAILDQSGDVLSYKDKNLITSGLGLDSITDQIKSHKQGSLTLDIDGVTNLVSVWTSPFNGWIYIALNPIAEVFKHSNEVIMLTLTASIIGIAVGSLLAIVISRNYSKPVQKMVTTISQLHNENNEMRVKFQHQHLIMRDHLLLSLLTGKKDDDNDDLIQQLNYYQIPLEQHCFVVLALRVHLPQVDDAEKAQHIRDTYLFRFRTICELMIERFGKGAYLSDYQQDIMIMNAKQWGDSDEQSHQQAKLLAYELKCAVAEELIGTELTIGIGGRYEQLSEITLSYQGATEALLYERIAGIGGIVSIDELQLNPSNRNRFITYRQQADQMIVHLKGGHLDKALQSKNMMFKQLKTNKQSDYAYKDMILHYLLNNIMMICLEMSGKEGKPEEKDNLYLAFNRLQSLEEIGVWFEGVFETIVAELQRKHENKNVEVINKLTDYIREHYREPINLQTVADLAYTNSQYFSKVFKEVNGTSFIEYLSRIRVEEACRLLRETDQTIIMVADATGFVQKQNLLRAFRKYTGQTPSEYRNNAVLHRLNNMNVDQV
ncbi:AraC family transcriptional regulator [Paenibacillus sp. Sa2BVA9]|uniref:AraC family transcriptional regulator n=2 Tax=Paenibacillus gallinarum TaxID=2762232 RepID=A0ABR8T0A5_9BACL|nr:AraC family transcriptional regulator [Paenibacillus gallinarum]